MSGQTQTQDLLEKEFEAFKKFVKERAGIDRLINTVEVIARKYGVKGEISFTGRHALAWDSRFTGEEVDKCLYYLLQNDNIDYVTGIAEVTVSAPRLKVDDVNCPPDINDLCTVLREFGRIHYADYDEDNKCYDVKVVKIIEEGELNSVEYGVYFSVLIKIYLPDDDDC